MDGGSARAFLRSFQSELVVRTDGRTEPFTFAVVIVIVTVSLAPSPSHKEVAIVKIGRSETESEWGEEDRRIRSAKLSPSFSHVLACRLGGEIVGDKEGREVRAR